MWRSFEVIRRYCCDENSERASKVRVNGVSTANDDEHQRWPHAGQPLRVRRHDCVCECASVELMDRSVQCEARRRGGGSTGSVEGVKVLNAHNLAAIFNQVAAASPLSVLGVTSWQHGHGAGPFHGPPRIGS